MLGTAAAAALPRLQPWAGSPVQPHRPQRRRHATTATTTTGIAADGPLAVLIDVFHNENHRHLGGRDYGLWLDGPINVYRGPAVKHFGWQGTSYTGGTQFAIFPHAQNFRFTVGDYERGKTFTNLVNVLDSAYDTAEGDYNYTSWLFGCWAEGNDVYAVAHYEWHKDTVLIDGKAFHADSMPARRYQANGIKWYKSNDLGRTWHQKEHANSNRLLVVPEPYDKQKPSVVYGWMQPSANIVREKSLVDGIDYYYFTAQAANIEKRKYVPNEKPLQHITTGFSLFRMSKLEDVGTVQFYNEHGVWQDRAAAGYQGNLSGQQPHIFFATPNIDPYTKEDPLAAPRSPSGTTHRRSNG